MYHYVRGESSRPPSGYYHLDIEDFCAQLDYLQREHGVISRETFLDCVTGDAPPPTDGVVLTFDDGLADHHEWVLPEIRSRGLWGVFFVSTAPLVYGRRLPVHRIHTLLSEYRGTELLNELQDVLQREGIGERRDGKNMYGGRDTANSVREFKHRLNRLVPDCRLSAVLDALEQAFPAARTDLTDLYLSDSQLREIVDAGMLVGAHSVTHPVLSDLPVAAQRWEIEQSRYYLQELLDTPVELFAYPYGGAESYTTETVDLVRAAGFDAAFTTVDGTAGPEAFDRQLTLPRRDCAALPHGESSVSIPSAER